MLVRSSSPPFSVWLRRVDPPEGPFVLRYEAREGKGALRTAHPGVIVDPPLRARADEPGLTLADLRAIRLVYAPAGGGPRRVYPLARLEAAALQALPKGDWVALEVASDGGVPCLQLPRVGPSAGEGDPPTLPFRVLSDLRADVEAPPRGPARAPQTDDPTESLLDEIVAIDLVEIAEAPPPPEETPPAAPPSAAPAAPAPDWLALAFHERPTTAIRHLRRVIRDLEAQNRALEARLARAGAPSDER